jgi:hypothetical protein
VWLKNGIRRVMAHMEQRHLTVFGATSFVGQILTR